VIRPGSERWNRQVLCKEEYRRCVANLPTQESVSNNVSNVIRNGPCNVLSVTRIREIPRDLQVSQAPRGSVDVEE
jgi:hypothetical protein